MQNLIRNLAAISESPQASSINSYVENVLSSIYKARRRAINFTSNVGVGDDLSIVAKMMEKEMKETWCSPVKLLGAECAMIVYMVPGLEDILRVEWGFSADDPKLKLARDRSNRLHMEFVRSGFGEIPNGGDLDNTNSLFKFAYWNCRYLDECSDFDSRRSFRVDNFREDRTCQIENGPVKWKIAESVKRKFRDLSLIATPLLNSEDAFVLLLVYYSNPYRVKHSGNVLQPEDSIAANWVDLLTELQEMLASEVFSPFYIPLARGKAPGIGELGPSLLEEAERTFHSESLSFSFPFKWKCLENSKLQDMNLGGARRILVHKVGIPQTDTIFESVLRLEEAIYNRLARRSLIPFADCSWGTLPKKLSLSTTLGQFESMERGAGMEKRDHVLHQFQCLLFGAIILDKFKNSFLEAMRLGNELTGEFAGIEPSDEEICQFLETCWFLVSTLHDSGNPIQNFDDISEALRLHVAKLLRVDYSDLSVPGKLRIDRVIYENPQSTNFLRELNVITRKSLLPDWTPDDDEYPEFEDDLLWLLQELAFRAKHHSIASVLTVALELGEKNPELLQAKSGQSRLILRHVFVPIVLHHVYEWVGRLDKAKNARTKLGKTRSSENEYDESKVKLGKSLEANGKLIGNVRTRLKRVFGARAKHGKVIDFQRDPITVLLLLVDFVQEWDSPSAGGKSYWPKKIKGNVDISDSRIEVNTRFTYAVDENDALKFIKDFKGERRKKWQIIRKIVDPGPLSEFVSKLEADVKIEGGTLPSGRVPQPLILKFK